MAKKSGLSFPSGQGGLISTFNSKYHTKFQFSPKLVIYFALLIVVFIWALAKSYS